MPFECCQCGECCANLGLVHTIRQDYGGFCFLLYNHYTGEETYVRVASGMRDLFLDTGIFSAVPHACPFFRLLPGSEMGCCTIHMTRPEICRDYFCWRLLILDHRGRRAGRIRYLRSLCSEDEHLIKIWNECIEPDRTPDDRLWEDKMIRTLTRAGYIVRQ